MSDFYEGPAKPIAPPPGGNKGGPGVYNETPGFPGRTDSPDAVPEKFYDSIPGARPQD